MDTVHTDPEICTILDNIDTDTYKKLGKTEMDQVDYLIDSYHQSHHVTKKRCQKIDQQLEVQYKRMCQISTALGLLIAKPSELDHFFSISLCQKQGIIDNELMRIAYFRQFILKPK